MPTAAREILVFIASPGDCDGERQVVRAVADAVTHAIGTKLGLRVRVEGWETLPPAFGRPQDQINPLVDDCDIFIGLLGHRWGSATGTHSSGFIEEFERAVQRRADADSPHIAVYFRNPPQAMLADPGPELRRVLAFQRRLRDEHVLLYKTFDNQDDLERDLWPLLSQLLVTFAMPGKPSGAEATSAGAAPEHTPSTEDLEGEDMDEARRQIVAITDTVTQLARGLQPERLPDSDRFLLIALGLNDDGGLLPTHIANRLYLRRSELALSMMEHGVWLRSLVADIGRSGSLAARVIPGWAALPTPQREFLNLIDSSDDNIVAGVFRALLRLGRRPDVLWGKDSDGADGRAGRWAAALQRPGAASVVETYLAAFATEADLPLLSEILSGETSRNVKELQEVLSGNASDMVAAVASRSYEPDWKATVLSDRLPSLDDETVRVLATGMRTPSQLRKLAARELHIRDLLTDEVLKSLITFPSAVKDIFGWIADDASPLNAEQVDRAVRHLDKDASNRWELEHRARAATTSTAVLLARLESGDDALSAWEALEWKEDSGLVEWARKIFDTDSELVVATLVDRWHDRKDLLTFVRSSSRKGALRILMRQDPVPEQDRARLRDELARGSIHTRQECLLWLAQVATPEDLTLLLSNLSGAYGESATMIIEAILRVGGRDGARRLLDVGEQDQQVLAVHALGQDQSTTTIELQELLYSPVDAVRIAALEQIAKRLNESQLRSLLDEYPHAHDNYYYNVVCELDWLLFALKQPAGGMTNGAEVP